MSMRVYFRLCYAEGNLLYFTDSFDTITGENWKYVPANDSVPPTEEGDTHIRYVGFQGDDVENNNDKFSVEQLNRKRAAWLWNEEAEGLYAGATIEEAIDWLHKAGAVCAELF